MKTLKFKLTGTSPLLMHNGELANPLNKYSKAIKQISGKRHKTEADHEEMGHLEFLGGLYLKNGEPCVPGFVFEGTIIGKGGAAKKESKGPQAKAGMFVPDDYPLKYKGPRSPEKLWEEKDFVNQVMVRVGMAKILRTRPIFNEWSTVVEIVYNPDILNEVDIVRWVNVAGNEVGLMDRRPRYGRFTVELLNGSGE